MKLSLQVVWFNWGEPAMIAPTLKRIAQAADQAGVDTLWSLDHFFQMEFAGRAQDPMLEAYTTLGFLAGVTERIRLGALVTGVIYRHPGALIKTVSALDVLSGGRAWLGIGAAWYEREARGLGLPFPPLAQRFEMLEETLQIAHRMWSGDFSPFRGAHYQLAEPFDYPPPLRRPPILIGGGGEKKTLRLVAQYADACNFDGSIGVDGIRHKLNVLCAHCAAVGRDFDAIERTLVYGAHRLPGGGADADAIIAYCQTAAEAGIQHIIFNYTGLHTPGWIEMIGERVIPAVRDL
jgi:F420-dependent oxidoreductase-like protein